VILQRRLPPLAVSMVGSWPRPRELLRAQREKRLGRIDSGAFDRVADDAVLDVLRIQEDLGLDLVTDGEQRRDNFYSFIADKLSGVRLMTLAEMLEIIEDKAAFEMILQTLDVPAYSISNPTCVGRIERRHPLAVDELRFVKRHTRRPVKVTLPGPYLMTRAMFVKEVAQAAYRTKEELAEDVVRVLADEIRDLVAEGVDFIQLDEPVLTELVFTQGKVRTFMCAALASTQDPTEELELAVHLINRVLPAAGGIRTGLHVCRGNWSPDETTLLRGGYLPLKPTLDRIQVRQLVLEYATERAGGLLEFDGKELGLGVVNPRIPTVESEATLRASIERAMELYPADRLFLNPDCGFATFSNRPVNDPGIAVAKMKAIVAAARSLRGEA
jgi:5-methyltetrahydropteroyltriglutamate--homocysteine methyltransferase